MNMAKFLYQIRNWRAHWRAFWIGSAVAVQGRTIHVLGLMDRLFGRHSVGRGFITYRGELSVIKIGRDGKRVDLGVVATRVVTTAGVNYLAADMNDGASDINAFDFHDSGTGAVAEAVGDTGLGTPAGPARVSGTASNPTANQYRSVATIPYTATLAITEHGLFSASTAGTLWDRSVFAAVNVVNGESIQFTYTLTINSGG